MASFQAKIVWKMPRKKEIKNYRFVPFLPDALRKIPKKFKKNTIMTSFQARIGLNRIRKRENKNYRFVPSLPDVLQKIPKKTLQKN